MIILDEVKRKLGELAPDVDYLKEALAIDSIKVRLSELEIKSSQPDFWSDADSANAVINEMKGIKSKIDRYENLTALLEDAETFCEMAQEEDDEALLPEVEEHVANLEKELESLRMTTLLSGEYDGQNAILTFHAGAGGTEAQDWAEMLYRMYNRYATANGFKVNLLDYLDGDEAGMKSASVLIEGENAYGMLKGENGVHRLVRVSPFDSGGRRHTSFASLEVMPEIDDSIKVDINPDDLKVDAFRASGAGGQHINKTSSAIRITHIPTGIVVSCQTQRSQFQNKDYAMRMLVSKLMQIKQQEHYDKIEDIKGIQNVIAWGSQIRSYVFMPYTLVKDHRTGFESGNVNAVMDGDIGGFINAYLKALNTGELK